MHIDIPKGKGTYAKSYAKAKVLVRQHLDGSWSVFSKDNNLIAKHPATPFREPIRQWKKRNAMPKGSGRRDIKNIEQIYINTTTPTSHRGHFPSAVKRGHFDFA